MIRLPARLTAGALSAALVWTTAIPLVAADPQRAAAAAAAEAGVHFQRGVQLFNEADYRAALVEFKRAYDIAPNPAVLYNIGQTHYQLQNYAAALTALQRYLAESGANAGHAAEVQQTIETLKARVGNLDIATNIPNCEVTIDDESVGLTPLAKPVLVSIGRRKITATHAGHVPATMTVEVAAGDLVRVPLTLGDADSHPTVTATTTPAPLPPAPEPSNRHGWLVAGWVTTGVLAVGGLTMGGLALKESSDLQNERNTFPVMESDLHAKANNVSLYSHIADGVGAAAIVIGGITLGFTLTSSDTHEVHAALTPTGVIVGGRFP